MAVPARTVLVRAGAEAGIGAAGGVGHSPCVGPRRRHPGRGHSRHREAARAPLGDRGNAHRVA
jgi:hypothetical protein